MMKSARKKVTAFSWHWLLLLLLLLMSAPRALAQQAASRSSTPSKQSQAAAPAANDVHARVNETLIDSSIPDDPTVDKLVAAYSPKVLELEVVIGKLKGELKKGGTGSGSMGNFVTDGMRAQTIVKTGKPVAVGILNEGGMRRSTIREGELKARDIFELLPFENALVTLDLTGEQLMKVLGVVVSRGEGQSGARLTYKINADKKTELERARLLDKGNREYDIDPKAMYTIVTIDYLVEVGGRYAILREGKNLKQLGITLREAIIAYVKSETAAGREIKPNLDGRFVLDRAGSVVTEEVRPR